MKADDVKVSCIDCGAVLAEFKPQSAERLNLVVPAPGFILDSASLTATDGVMICKACGGRTHFDASLLGNANPHINKPEPPVLH